MCYPRTARILYGDVEMIWPVRDNIPIASFGGAGSVSQIIPSNSYVAEDGAMVYTTEDGTAPYFTEA